MSHAVQTHGLGANHFVTVTLRKYGNNHPSIQIRRSQHADEGYLEPAVDIYLDPTLTAELVKHIEAFK